MFLFAGVKQAVGFPRHDAGTRTGQESYGLRTTAAPLPPTANQPAVPRAPNAGLQIDPRLEVACTVTM